MAGTPPAGEPAHPRRQRRPRARARTAARIFTGAPIAARCGGDAGALRARGRRGGVSHASRGWEAVRRAGEDTFAGRAARRCPTPQAVALLAGRSGCLVLRRVSGRRVLHRPGLRMRRRALPAGRHLATQPVRAGGLLAGPGCEVEDLGIVPDVLNRRAGA